MSFDPHPFVAALADPTRLRALVLLDAEGELCVCELTAALDVSQPKMSRHLAALRELGVVADRREANRIYYRLAPGLPDWARQAVRQLAVGLDEWGQRTADRARLRTMPNRPPRRAAA